MSTYYRPRRDSTEMISAKPVMEHIRFLHEEVNMSYLIIAHEVGLTVQAISFLMRVGQEKMHRISAQGILAIRPEDAFHSDLPGHTWVPAYASQRRIRALQSMGYPSRDLEMRTGTAIRHTMRPRKCNTCALATHQKIEAVYNELSHIRGPSNITYMWSIKRYPPPMAWDDIEDWEDKPKGWAPTA